MSGLTVRRVRIVPRAREADVRAVPRVSAEIIIVPTVPRASAGIITVPTVPRASAGTTTVLTVLRAAEADRADGTIWAVR